MIVNSVIWQGTDQIIEMIKESNILMHTAGGEQTGWGQTGPVVLLVFNFIR